VRSTDGGEELFTLRTAAGLLYDSRVVHDRERTEFLAFRGGSKHSIAAGFEIIDLRGETRGDWGVCPRLGRVVSVGGRYRLDLVAAPESGWIEARGSNGEEGGTGREFELVAAPELLARTNGITLLLSAALALSWRPPPG
jgi:hypothetical protein